MPYKQLYSRIKLAKCVSIYSEAGGECLNLKSPSTIEKGSTFVKKWGGEEGWVSFYLSHYLINSLVLEVLRVRYEKGCEWERPLFLRQFT